MRLTWIHALTITGCLAICMVATVANAQLVNGDFESGTFTFDGGGGDSLPSGSTNITGWTTIDAELVVITDPNSFGVSAFSGINHLDLTGYHDSTPYAGIEQTVNTLAGQNYNLSFYIGTNGSTVSVDVSTGGAPTTFSNFGANRWEQFTDSFTATGPTTITLTGSVAAGGGTYIGLDDITLPGTFGSSATPEPGSLALFVAGGMSLMGIRALRRNRTHKRSR